jgi:hypothetical protein
MSNCNSRYIIYQLKLLVKKRNNGKATIKSHDSGVNSALAGPGGNNGIHG